MEGEGRTMDDILHVIGHNKLFTGLDTTLLRRIASAAERVNTRAGEILYQQGDPADAVWGVLSGRVNETLRNEEGREMTVGVIEAGEIFGEVAVLDWGTRRVEVVAAADSVLFRISRRHFLEFLQVSPELCFRVFALLSSHVRETTDTLEEAALQKFPARLAKKLVALATGKAGDPEAPAANPETVVLAVSQSDLARLTGVHRETVNRHLRGWEKEGFLALGRGRITIKDMTQLSLLALPAETGNGRAGKRSLSAFVAGHDADEPRDRRTGLPWDNKGSSGVLPESDPGLARPVMLSIGIEDYSPALRHDVAGTLGFLKTCLRIIDRTVADVGGHVIGHAGDDILAEFADGASGLAAARLILDRVGSVKPPKAPAIAPEFRLGLAAASATADVTHPRAVALLASSLKKLAEPGTAYLNDAVLANSVPVGESDVRELGRFTLPRLVGPVTVHRLQHLGETGRFGALASGWRRLVLRYQLAPRRYRLALYASLAILLVAVGSVLNDLSRERRIDTLATPQSYRLAVLPFELGEGIEINDFLATGLAKSIEHGIGGYKSVAVVRGPSAAELELGNFGIPEATELLAVDYMVTGSVARADGGLAIAVSLNDTSTGLTVWTGEFTAPETEILDIGRTVAQQVIVSLSPRIDDAGIRAGQQQTQSLIAFELYLSARDMLEEWQWLQNDWSGEGIVDPRVAEAQLERAVTLDPDFAAAWAALGKARLFIWDGSSEPERAAMEAAITSAADRAIELDPNVGEAYVVKALQDLWGRWLDRHTRESEAAVFALINQAIDVDPDLAFAYRSRARLYDLVREPVAAFREWEKALSLAPLSKDILFTWSEENLARGNTQEAWQALDRLGARAGVDHDFVVSQQFLFDYDGGRLDRALARYYLEEDRLQARQTFGPMLVDALLDIGALETAAFFTETGTDGSIFVDLARGNLDRAMKTKLALFQDRGDVSYFRRATFRIAMLARKFETAVELAGGLRPEFVETRRSSRDELNAGLLQTELAYSYRWSGNDEASAQALGSVDAFLSRLRDGGFDGPAYHYESARLQSMRGRPDEAMASLTRAVDRGYRRVRLRLDPTLDAVRGRLDYADLIARIDHENAGMRAELCRLTAGVVGRPRYCDEDVAP